MGGCHPPHSTLESGDRSGGGPGCSGLKTSSLSPLRIEETWRLWSKFLDDHARFEDWLRPAEVTAASPQSADVLYTTAKEELKKFEVQSNSTFSSEKVQVLVQVFTFCVLVDTEYQYEYLMPFAV